MRRHDGKLNIQSSSMENDRISAPDFESKMCERLGKYVYECFSSETINIMKEKTLRKQLILRDLATLHPSLKTKPLVPFACFFDKNNHAIYRVDLLDAEVKLGSKERKHHIDRTYWLDYFDTHQTKQRK